MRVAAGTPTANSRTVFSVITLIAFSLDDMRLQRP
jgi:hypothetical protein